MNKVSSQDAAALLKQAGAAIRTLVQERDDALQKLSSLAHEERIEKIARDMEDKGLASEFDFEQKVAQLRSAPSLDVTEEAVKLSAPQKNPFGDPSDVPGAGGNPFEHFILTGEDPR